MAAVASAKYYPIHTPTEPFPRIAQFAVRTAPKIWYLPANAVDTTTDEVESIRERFEELADTWEHETAGSSLVRNKINHPAYRQIVDLGASALPFILDRLERKGGFWFGALYEIQGECIPSDEDMGDRDRMTAAWLRWGRENGLC